MRKRPIKISLRRPLAEYAELRRQLAGIGKNINQIAHVVNTRGLVRKENIAAVTAAQRVIWQIAKRHSEQAESSSEY